MAGIVITALLALSMWVAIVLLARHQRRAADLPALPGQLSAAERRRLYKRLGLDPALLAHPRPRYEAKVIPFRPDARRRRSTEA
ncbi:hypothetical protein ACFSCW_01040 [Sphingomonas tabacisoli]|uniref:Uncharacterized protein n=1 Tax=Sphingomonas tabacisoli TaxID=2249466 RepID=A0ABW4HYZ2_9SPHN